VIISQLFDSELRKLGTRAEEIEELDQTGIALTRELKAHFGHSAKVQYYRAGKLRRISP